MNIYFSLYRGNGASDTDYLAEAAAYTDCCKTGVGLTTNTICDNYLARRPACSSEEFVPATAGKQYLSQFSFVNVLLVPCRVPT